MLSDVNFFAVIVSAVLSMAIGFVWYMPSVFGKQWMKELKLGEKDIKKEGMGKTYLLMGLSALVTSFVLAQVVSLADAATVSEGVVVALWVWVGFVATTLLGGLLFERKSVTWYLITAGYQLVAFVVMGAIFAVWV